ncbi:MAG TPA: ATP-binding protein [archaeon]|nr:ATP-binding protein [archaeon]
MLMLKTPVRYLDFYGLKTDPTKARVVISTEHAEDVFDLIKAEKSVRLVAEAGTGKTTILREVKKKLVEEFDGRLLVPIIPFDALPDTSTHTYIGRGGITVIGRYIVRELKKSTGGIPGKISDDVAALRRSGRDVSAQEKSDHIHQILEKIREPPIEREIAIFFDDADSLASVEDLNTLGEFIDNCYATVFAMKPSVGSEIKGRDPIEEKVLREKSQAFLRRTQEYTINGYPVKVLMEIVERYVSQIKRKERRLVEDAPLFPFNNKALAIGLGVAYTMKEDGEGAKLYKPDRFLDFLSQCLQIGYHTKTGLIEPGIAKKAAQKTAYGRSRDAGMSVFGQQDGYEGEVERALADIGMAKPA